MHLFAYSIFCILLYTAHASDNCISSDDIKINENNVGEAVRSLIDGSTSFSLEMLKSLNANTRNNTNSNGIFFSPFSIWSALTVTFMGSNGKTEEQMRKVLGIGNLHKVVAWMAYRNLRIWNRNREGQEKNLLSANKIFFQDGIKIEECMKSFIEKESEYVDFMKDSDGARNIINSWVEKQTQQKIKDLIPPKGISQLTRMVIANAVYFKESWLLQFDPKNTKKLPFTVSSQEEITANMMNIRGRFLYGASDDLKCTALELPYKGNELSMMILLPRNRYHGVGILANLLTPEKLYNLMADMYPREVLVSIPKFHDEDTFELAQVLSKMGLNSLFNHRLVDLSGFTGENVNVDAVHHKSFIDVNEEGTEAAAATAIVTSRAAGPALTPAAFIANYPFIFFIRDNISNVIIFAGTVQRPSKAT